MIQESAKVLLKHLQEGGKDNVEKALKCQPVFEGEVLAEWILR